MHAPRTPKVRLSIPKNTRLAAGRLPIHRKEAGETIFVSVDPVSLCALLASAGRVFPLQEVMEEFAVLGAAPGAQQVHSVAGGKVEES